MMQADTTHLNDNPLYEAGTLPRFDAIQPEHAGPAIRARIDEYRSAVASVCEVSAAATWDTVMAPLERADHNLMNAWSPVSHLAGVMDSPAWREAYSQCLADVTAFETWLSQHQGLYQRYRLLRDEADLSAWTPARMRSLELALRQARLAGVGLPEDQRTRFATLTNELSALGQRFSENLLDATQGWTHQITDVTELAGLPDDALDLLADNARQAGQDGWLLTLDVPSFLPVMTYAQNRALRARVHRAFTTRASDQAEEPGAWDNSPLLAEIMDKRQEAARLLGFEHPAELSLAEKMADSAAQVRSFLLDLAEKSLPRAGQDMTELAEFAGTELGLEPLQPWDIAYASDQLKRRRFDLSSEMLKPWFPVPRVTAGLFETVHRLYGVAVTPVEDGPVYHPDVQLYALREQGRTLAWFYLDLYARQGKRGGAWMDEARVRRTLDDGETQLPVAYLCCNFPRPAGGKPALLTHDDVTTLFHEFGHGLHHMLTEVGVGAVSGINGVAWDAVELPSQFMENFCWEPAALAFISGHVDTGDALPDDLLQRMLAARNFQAAMQMVRQLEFSLFDLDLHTDYAGGGVEEIRALLAGVRSAVSVVPTASYQRFENSFAHIFAGGYAAGYYSYKWAEVLSADAYSRFEDEGVFSQAAATDFRQHILARGGSADIAELYEAFRGRPATNDALLRHHGIVPAES